MLTPCNLLIVSEKKIWIFDYFFYWETIYNWKKLYICNWKQNGICCDSTQAAIHTRYNRLSPFVRWVVEPSDDKGFSVFLASNMAATTQTYFFVCLCKIKSKNAQKWRKCLLLKALITRWRKRRKKTNPLIP